MAQNMAQRLGPATTDQFRHNKTPITADAPLTIILEISGGGFRPWCESLTFELPALFEIRMNPIHWKRQLEAKMISIAKERWSAWQKHALDEWENTAGLTGLPAGMNEGSFKWKIIQKNETDWWNDQWERCKDNETVSAAITCAWQFAPRLRIRISQISRSSASGTKTAKKNPSFCADGEPDG